MAELADLTQSLLKRLKGVPNVEQEDAEEWMKRSMLEHGYAEDADVPTSDTLLVLLFAEWDACLQIARNSAHFFQYKDAEETVDKRSVSEQYRRIAAELKDRYERKKAEGTDGLGGSRFVIAPRADR